MSIWTRIRDVFTAPSTSVTRLEPQALNWGGINWDEWSLTGNSSGGVSENMARSVTAVHACVSLIGGSISSMPCHLYQRTTIDGRSGRKRYSPPLWWLLNERPHERWSAAAMWGYLSDSRQFHGDAFAWIHRKSRYSEDPSAFEPLHPMRVEVLTDGDRRAYRYSDPETSKQTVILSEDMLHIPGAGYNGVRSMSALRFGLLNAAGIAIAGDEQQRGFFEDGVRADFAIEIPNAMSKEQQAVLRESFLARHSGAGAKRAPIVLAGGMKLHQLTMTSEDAQLLATRSFQIEEVCRMFGVPPFMIGHMTKSTAWGTGIEQMGIGFNKYTLAPILTAIEQELNFKLFKTSRNFAEFVTAGLERGDLKTRYESYRIGLGRAGEKAWLTVNDVRDLENMPPVDGGDVLGVEEPAKQVDEPAPEPPAPQPAKGADDETDA